MKKTFYLIIIILVSFLSAFLYFLIFGQGERFLVKPATKSNPNIILITVDTLRADHMGLYGYKYNTTPHIDEFAKKAVVFEYPYCPIPKTSASFASMMTGLHPFVHQTNPNKDVLNPKFITLAEALRMKGYYNYAVVDNSNLAKRFKFNQGFQEYIQVWNFKESKQQSTVFITNKGLEFLKNDQKKPFFLWLHYIEPHSPYVPPQEFIEKRPAGRTILDIKNKAIMGEGKNITAQSKEGHFTALHDGAIKYIDSEFKKLIDQIFERNLQQNSLIIFTSDHGEELGEKNLFYGHGGLTFSASSRVPLIFYGQGYRPRRVKRMVSIMDIYPTILKIVGLHLPYDIQGLDLFSETQEKRFLYVYGISSHSIFYNHYHYIKLPKKTFERLDLNSSYFFNTQTDPYEVNNLSYKNKQLQNLMSQNYDKFFKLNGGYSAKRFKKKQKESYTKEELKSLKTLGYID